MTRARAIKQIQIIPTTTSSPTMVMTVTHRRPKPMLPTTAKHKSRILLAATNQRSGLKAAALLQRKPRGEPQQKTDTTKRIGALPRKAQTARFTFTAPKPQDVQQLHRIRGPTSTLQPMNIQTPIVMPIHHGRQMELILSMAHTITASPKSC